MATSSDVKVKKEPGEDFKEVTHRHRFSIQLGTKDNRLYEINGEDFETVLQAIKSIDEYAELGWSDENLVIQRKKDGSEFTIATHFPCCLINEDEKLTVSKRRDQVEEIIENRNVLSKESYSVFVIDGHGAKNTSTGRLFISSQRQDVKPLYVYGEKGKSAKEALDRDGRFKPFRNFKLIDCNNDKVLKSSAATNDLHGRKFKIELPKEKQENAPKQLKSPTKSAKKRKRVEMAAALYRPTAGTTAASNMAAQSSNTAVAPALLQQSGLSVKKALSQSCSDADREVIYKLLRDQFSELKTWMMSRFPADSLQKELRVRKENFGKVRKSFSNFYTTREMIRMGESVCRVDVRGICTGTGFVLFDNLIMTNAHLFKKCTDGDRVREGTEVHVQFNYGDPQIGQHLWFKVEQSLIGSTEGELDYAVLQVNYEEFKQFIQTEQIGVVQFPSGLLEKVGEMPKNGGACIIGHPEGKEKQIDLTSVIEIEKRKQAAEENLIRYKVKPYGLFGDPDKSQGIGRIMVGGADAEKVITYNTFMYHGASGSPVFDAHGSLCGLHTSGYYFGPEEANEYVIEFAYSMKTIITHFVKTLHEKNLTVLLQRLMNVAGNNPVLREIFGLNNQPV